MTLLLDTCTFVWLADEEHRLSDCAREVLADSSNILRLHQVSAWEIQVKYSLGKFPMPKPPRVAVPAALAQFGLEYRTLGDETVYFLERLPHLHRDPFDRLLIAHALHEGVPIVSPDPLIHQYPVRVIW